MDKRKCLILGIVSICLFFFCVYENSHLVVTHYDYETEGDSRFEESFRIVHISDVHNASFGKGNTRLLKKIQELSPDIIVVTGDLVDGNRTNIKIAAQFVKDAMTIAPVYYVTGNHEYYLEQSKREKLFEDICETGATILMNEKVIVSNGKEEILLVGLDDESLFDSTLQKILQDCEENVPSVVLAHEPQFINRYSAARADLVLTGHAHGGQVRLPFIGGLVAPGQGFFPKYTEGAHKQENTTMIVSRGLGNSIIPVRLFNDPEIVCVDLQ